ncbi:MAG: response regulator transcription factor [Saprospiraceae bacterium]|nr:response regulator transcription factor [Saprospiraceae bacterium]MCB9312061.1 response regulator transcription factor [Lewinellaceae bacterium]HRW76690.1 response regulator transcription factor [Saprospiraceae bacterium]
MRILIVEDEPGVASFVARGLTEAGHQPEIATTGDGGLALALDKEYDTLVLDLILPGMTGLEVCRRYREAKGFDIPIIMLTALGSTEDIVAGLKVGADDYLVKPFKFKELLARIEALSRGRQQQATPEKLTSADLEVDLYRRMVSRAGQSIRLTAREYDLLVYLLKNKGRVVSREAILAAVWEMDWDVETNVVDVYINYLRNKVDKPFDQKLIKTMIGMGYVLTEEAIA